MSGWISVGERLPERGQTVLAWAPDGHNQVKDVLEKVFFHDAGHWTYGYHSNNLNGVTHWMHLPEPPPQKKDSTDG